MKPIELRKPVRSDYESDSEWLDAMAIEVRLYNRRLAQAIDSDTRSYAQAVGKDHKTEREKEKYHADTIHDYLSSHPLLMARYKQIGIGALLEI
jgi:hypothetical protein